MIAAVDAQGWVPSGRGLGHPGRLMEPQPSSSNTDPLAEQIRSMDLSDNIKEWWQLRSCPGNQQGEDELHVRGRTVIWSRGAQAEWQTLRSFTLDNPVIAACWARFHPSPSLHQLNLTKPEPSFEGVCIVDSQNISVFAEDGRDYVSCSQFPVSSVWPVHLGVLLEMDSPSMLEDPSERMHLPLIYSLQHPYDDIKPVVTKKSGKLGAVTQAGQKLIFTNENPPLCVMHNLATGQHSAWTIRKATMQESFSPGGFCDMTYGSDAIFPSAASSSNSPNTPIHPSHRTRSDSLRQSMGQHSPIARTSMANSYINTTNKRHSMATPHRESPPRRPSLAQSLGGLSGGTCSPFTSWRRDSSLDLRSPLGSTTAFEPLIHPLFPEICLEHRWTETYKPGNEWKGAASRVFLCSDLVGVRRLCFMVPFCKQLMMVKLEESNQKEQLIFGATCSLPALDAAALSDVPLIVLLEKNGGLALYSGPQLVAKVMVPSSSPTAGQIRAPSSASSCGDPPFLSAQSLIGTSTTNASPLANSFKNKRSSLRPECSLDSSYFGNTSCALSPVLPSRTSLLSGTCPVMYEEPQTPEMVHLRDPTARAVTIEYNSGYMVRISLPEMHTSLLVRRTVGVLRSVLMKKDATTLLARWYCVRNAPGAQNIDSESEWHLFMTALLGLLGYEVDKLSLVTARGMCNDVGSVPQEKRKRKSDEGTEEDWNWLLNKYSNEISDMSRLLCMNCPVIYKTLETGTANGVINTEAPLFFQMHKVLFALHLLYEDMKLDLLARPSLPLLAPLLHLLATDLGHKQHADLYWRNFPTQCRRKEGQMTAANLEKLNSASQNANLSLYNLSSSLLQFLKTLTTSKDLSSYPYSSAINSHSKDIVEIVGFLTQGIAQPRLSVDTLTFDIGQSDHPAFVLRPDETLPLSTTFAERAVMLMVKKGITRQKLERLPPSLAVFFLAAASLCCREPPPDWPPEAYSLVGREDLTELCKQSNTKSDVPSAPLNKLSPTTPTSGNTEVPEDGEDGMEGLDMEVLSLRFPKDQRVLSVRRMLQSARPVRVCVTQRPEVSDHDFIEEQERTLYAICTRTMALPIGRGMFTLGTVRPVVMEPLPVPRLNLHGRSPARGTTVDLSHIETVPNMNLWPLFHNGVAAGLRVCPAAQGIDSTWIAYNKQKSSTESQTEHAGFLMALGLNGHLSSLNNFKIYEYLQKCHEMTSVGLLLGIAASKRGSSDQETSQTIRTICLHIEAMLPPTSLELNIAQNVQVAALLGLGLLYQGSAHRHITEVLLSEIGRPPGPEMENCVDRESYSLAAGLALGLVVLGQGEAPMADLRDLAIPDTLHHYMVGGHARQLAGSQRDKYRTPSYQIREGDAVNVHVTCPGATLALGMLFFRTGNQAVAGWMQPPDTQYLLDFIRPDFLLLRVLARGLILWDDILPTKKWVEGNVPSSIRPAVWSKPAPETEPKFDLETMNQSYSNILAGACLAMGLRFAGSANDSAFSTLYHYAMHFVSLLGRSAAEIAGKSTVECCTNVVLLSMALVMAGTGNLQCLRLIRLLRSRVGTAHPVVTYGSHVATHMSLGLLFLGGGRYTLSTSPQAIAALLCACFPKFPTHSNDNRYHLQAFRHLYVLAAEPRLLVPRCVDARTCDYTNLRVVYIDTPWYKDQEVALRAPCLLPELKLINKVVVTDNRYWPIVFERGRNWDQLEQLLKCSHSMPVKRRAGCLPYVDDPLGYRTLFAQSLTSQACPSWSSKLDTILAFSESSLVNFARLFLSEKIPAESLVERSRKERMRALTRECCLEDKSDALPFVMACLEIVDKLERGNPDPLAVWDVKLLWSMVSLIQEKKFPIAVNVVSGETANAIHGRIRAVVDSYEQELLPSIISYLKGEDMSLLNDQQSLLLTTYLTFYDIPTPSIIKDLPWPCSPIPLMIHKVSAPAVDKLMQWQRLNYLSMSTSS